MLRVDGLCQRTDRIALYIVFVIDIKLKNGRNVRKHGSRSIRYPACTSQDNWARDIITITITIIIIIRVFVRILVRSIWSCDKLLA